MSKMHDVLFEVFKEVPDHFDWEKHIEFASVQSGITGKTIQKLIMSGIKQRTISIFKYNF